MDIDVSKLPTSPSIDVNRLFITVYLTDSLQNLGFKGFAKSISSVNKQGPFDILPAHENFVTEFSNKLDILTDSGEKVSYANSRGVLEVANNIVRVYLES